VTTYTGEGWKSQSQSWSYPAGSLRESFADGRPALIGVQGQGRRDRDQAYTSKASWPLPNGPNSPNARRIRPCGTSTIWWSAGFWWRSRAGGEAWAIHWPFIPLRQVRPLTEPITDRS